MTMLSVDQEGQLAALKGIAALAHDMIVDTPREGCPLAKSSLQEIADLLKAGHLIAKKAVFWKEHGQ